MKTEIVLTEEQMTALLLKMGPPPEGTIRHSDKVREYLLRCEVQMTEWGWIPYAFTIVPQRASQQYLEWCNASKEN